MSWKSTSIALLGILIVHVILVHMDGPVSSLSLFMHVLEFKIHAVDYLGSVAHFDM